MADLTITDSSRHFWQRHMVRICAPIAISRRDHRRCAHNSFMLAALCLTGNTSTALAHVKWFCNYNIAEPPVPLVQVISGAFVPLIMLSILIFTTATLFEYLPIGDVIHKAINWLTEPLKDNSETLLRAIYGGFFVALWAQGDVILTPELKTAAAWIPWLQLTIAIGLLWRSTLALSGVGIIVLFVNALVNYGTFHLMDYPIFLGVAAYFIIIWAQRWFSKISPLDIVRYCTAISLMWVSVEKWAYPDWIYPILISHPEMTFGFDVAFYIKAAGMVEFSLAFALFWTPLARRVAALVFTLMLASAIVIFGKIDAIGHAPIIVILLVIAADSTRSRPHHLSMVPVSYAGAVVGAIATYYITHALLFSATADLHAAFGL